MSDQENDLALEPVFKQNSLIQFTDVAGKRILINPFSISDVEYDFINDRFVIITMNSGNAYTITQDCREVMKKIGVNPEYTIINPIRDATY